MPLYAGIGGAQKEIGEIYAGIGGYAKKLEQLYAGVGGAAKELLPSGYTWKRYMLSSSTELVYVTTVTKCDFDTTENNQNALTMYATTSNALSLDGSTITFSTSKCSAYWALNMRMHADADHTGHYYPLNDDYSLMVYYGDAVAKKELTCNYVLRKNSTTTAYAGDVYKTEFQQQRGDYIDSVTSKTADAYPMNGTQDGYWYVYDGEVTWAKYYLNQISEPSTFGSEASFSSSQSWPLLMASQAKKDSNGNVDWGTTYSASSAANLRSNYSKYPYCSFASTLNADNLYMITTASFVSYKRKQVTGWAVTSESAGDYIGDVTGKIGDYPENGIQDGFWYIQQEIT